MKILTMLFVLTIAFSAEAAKKVFVTYLINGTVDSINVARLSENLIVEKVVSKTLPTPGGLTSIQVGNNPENFLFTTTTVLCQMAPLKSPELTLTFWGTNALGPTRLLGISPLVY